VYRNVDASTPFDVADTVSSVPNTGFPDPPPILPVTEGAWVVAAGGKATTLTTVDPFTCANLEDFYSQTPDSAISGGFRPMLGVGHHRAWTSTEGTIDPDIFAGPTGSTIEGTAAITAVLRPANPG